MKHVGSTTTRYVVLGGLALAANFGAGCSGASFVTFGPSADDAGGQDVTTGDVGTDSETGTLTEASSNNDGAKPPQDVPRESGADAASDAVVDSTVDALADVAMEAAPSCISGKTACSTGFPGACGAGVLLCDGGAHVCQPLASSQPCYTGLPGTDGVGACHSGTQSCAGTLGVCNGEVLPAKYENCFNDTDDDCNGVVNNGCPLSLSLGPDRALAAEGGMGGSPTTAHCPQGAFITRVDSWFDDIDGFASGVSFFCATPILLKGASSYSVTLAAIAPAPYTTVTGLNYPTDERTDDCGLTGLSAITSTTGLADSFVEGLGYHCGKSAVRLQADNTISFNFVGSGDTTYQALPGATGTVFNEGCRSDEVMVGFNLREGDWFDSVQPICAELLVNYHP
jgi:hypothetical protein